jgi:hypothetical protein
MLAAMTLAAAIITDAHESGEVALTESNRVRSPAAALSGPGNRRF